MKMLRTGSLLLLAGSLSFAPRLNAQYTLTYSTNGSVITLIGYTGAPVNVSVPSFVTAIGGGAFWKCPSLASITIPDSVITVGTVNDALGVFGSCTNLTNAIFGDNVATIGADAFSFCTNLASIAFPSSVTAIGLNAFFGCFSLTNFGVSPSNPAYSSSNGVLFNSNQTVLVGYPGGLAGGYTIPNSVGSLGDSAFTSCHGLTSVTIPVNVTNLSGNVFSGCTNLTNVAIADGISNIGLGTFTYCTGLTQLIIPGSIFHLADSGAFQNCSNLQSVLFTGNAPSVDCGVFPNDPVTIYYLPRTTGWSSTFACWPAVLWNPTLSSTNGSLGFQDNPFGFTVTGTTNIPIVIAATSNLAGGIWTPLQSCTLTNGSIYFTDTNSANSPNQFYTVQFP